MRKGDSGTKTNDYFEGINLQTIISSRKRRGQNTISTSVSAIQHIEHIGQNFCFGNTNDFQEDQHLRDLLHKAITTKKMEVIGFLVEFKADLNSGIIAPLFWAVAVNSCEIVKLLLDLHANVNLNTSLTALQTAAGNGNDKMVGLLLDYKAEINLRSKTNGQTALHMSAHEKIVQSLFQKNADINLRDNDGYTALHIAAQNGKEDVVQCLIENKADINTTAKKVKTYVVLNFLVKIIRVMASMVGHIV
jgi:ankyrin repeat protein